jgi:two-component system sensor histidine kinase MprB
MALLVGSISALAMLVGGVLSYGAVRDEQYGTIDDFLNRRGDATEQFTGGRGALAAGSPRVPGRPSVDDGVVLQVNGPDGSLLLTLNPDVELNLPRAEHLGEMRTERIDGERFRVRADVTADGLTVQLARSLTEADNTVEAIRNRLWLLGVLVSFCAAALGWIAAGRIARPIERLSEAADHIAKTTDLDAVETPAGDPTTKFEVGRLAASFSSMLDALRRSREQQQHFVADAGHEMRTPLTTLRTNVEMLQSHRLSDDDEAASLEAIAREVDEMTNLTNELVELSTAPAASETRRVNLAETVAIAVERARVRHSREISVEGESMVVAGRPASLDRAVTNLIDNAVKFSPAGSRIDVTVGQDQVSVRDRGAGIDAADVEHVFERFYRADGARTLPGSGLGLSIVAKVAHDHGGTAFIEQPVDGPGVVVGFTVEPAPGDS